MTMKTKLAVLFSAAALMTAPLMGCGETDDPTLNQNQGDGTGDNGNGDNGNGDNGNGDNGNGDNGNGDNGNGDNGNGDNGNGDNGNGDNGNGDNGNGDNGDEYEPCDAAPFFYGEIGENPSIGSSGGNATTDAFTFDAGIQDLYDRIDQMIADGEISERNQFGSYEPAMIDPPIEINGAVITATQGTGVADERFYIGDADGGFLARLDGDDSEELSGIRVGQRVSFTVTEVGFFGNNPQIRSLTNFQFDAEDEDVHIIELTEGALPDDFMNRNVKVSGRFGDRWNCGTNRYCFRIHYGPEGEDSVVFRFFSNDPDGTPFQTGRCLHYAGIVGAFPGLYNEDGDPIEPQIEEHNWDWTFASDD